MQNVSDYATPFEQLCIEAYQQYGSFTAAGAALDCHRSTIQRAIARAEGRAAEKGHLPTLGVMQAVPEPFIVDRMTLTRVGENGRPDWIKLKRDPERAKQIVRETIEAMAEEIVPAEPVPPPSWADDELLVEYVFTDYHMNMLASAGEGGITWNMEIAERLLLSIFLVAIARAPQARFAVLVFLGDLLHSDSMLPVTPAHRHVLDQSARFPDAVHACIRVIKRMIRSALEKHDQLHLVIAEGNHDESTMHTLQSAFEIFYESESRMTVNPSKLPFYAYSHGKVFLGYHHGHKVKWQKMPMRFATEFPALWGQTTYRYIACGHHHTEQDEEFDGAVNVRHPTLSARDAHAARGFPLSQRGAVYTVYHRELGRLSKNYLRPNMVEVA